MASTCYFPVLNGLNNQIISCKVSFDKESKIKDLSLVQGVYSSKTRNDDKLILVNNNNVNIKVPENSGKLSTLAIILIIVGVVLVISGVAVFLIIKYKVVKKENKEEKNKKGITRIISTECITIRTSHSRDKLKNWVIK